LYEVLTSRLPFASVEQIFTQDAVSPAILNPNIPRQLDLLLLKCLQHNSRDRYESFADLIKELVAIYFALPREEKAFGERYVVKGRKEPLIAMDFDNKGISLGELGKPEDAIACYDMALGLNPRSAESWNNKGLALRALGRPEEAIACYDRALEVDPRYAEAWYNKGNALLDLRRSEQAIACYDTALDLSPRYATAWAIKGTALGALGRSEEAIACFMKFVELAPPQDASLVKLAEETIRKLRKQT
jgi:tetratricopeptide (TPR) repeat protein